MDTDVKVLVTASFYPYSVVLVNTEVKVLVNTEVKVLLDMEVDTLVKVIWDTDVQVLVDAEVKVTMDTKFLCSGCSFIKYCVFSNTFL